MPPVVPKKSKQSARKKTPKSDDDVDPEVGWW